MMTVCEKKRCTKCGQWHQLDMFERRIVRGRSYPHSHCKPCRKAYFRAEYRPGRRKYRNLDDRYYTLPHGERAASAKLTAHDVRLIRGLLADGLSCVVIAGKFEVAASTVWAIREGMTWSRTA